MTISDGNRQELREFYWYDRTPLYVLLSGISAISMFVPAIFAASQGDFSTARPFLYGGALFLTLSVLIGLATQSRPMRNQARGLLLSLLASCLLLPIFLAAPIVESIPGLSPRQAYLEMVSSVTTTGLTIFDQPTLIPEAIHLWRAQVAWMGGFLMWVAAIAVLAPLRLGGFEVVTPTGQLGRNASLGRSMTAAYPMRRIWRYAADLAPIYGGLTLTLWLLLLFTGEDPFLALIHAMSTISTSGISSLDTLETTVSGRTGEVAVALFMVFALARCTFASDMPIPIQRKKYQDPELRIAAFFLALVPAVMFVHHWFGQIDATAVTSVSASFRAYWGSFFTTVSFLSTTGFVSGDWEEARQWSGLATPGLILMGLALVGGGVATTAGGVKLLRVYALYKHGRLELDRLVHPSIVASPGNPVRRVKREGAYLAWLFFMLFALSFAAVMIALSLALVDFETALLLTVASLSTTGPLTQVVGETPITLATLSPAAHYIMCAAMALGRLETLAIIALLNPDFWRA